MSGNSIFFVLLLILLSGCQLLFAQPRLNIIYPKENDQIIASDSTFIYGNFWPKAAEISINKKKAAIFPNGTFLAMIPVNTGHFSIKCQASFDGDTTTVLRNIYVPFYLKSCPKDTLVIDTSYVFPRENWGLYPGDVINVAIKASPGCSASFKINGLTDDLPMVELKPKARHYWGEAIFGQGTNSQMAEVQGIYTGSYIIQPWDWGANRKISFQLQDKNGATIEASAPGRINIDPSPIPKIAQLIKNVVRVRGGPRIGGQLFLPKGAIVNVENTRGDYIRIRYSENNDVWIKKENLLISPQGTTKPEGYISAIHTRSKENWSTVEVMLDHRLPFKVEQNTKPAFLEVTFYGVGANNDSIRLEFDDPLINDIKWEQKSLNVYSLKIGLNQKSHWGYDPFYENGNFFINIKKKPKIANWPNSPLKNMVICLDPGHSPDLGALGATGTPEKDINFDYCEVLKLELEKKGAFVVLTRDRHNGISLAARSKFAKFVGADILLSMHFNGLPDGVSAFKIRGISTYYNQPHSYRLASKIHKSLVKATGMENFGLYYSNLAICRTPQMISVLLEPGFLTHPEEEKQILSESNKRKVTAGIVKALEQFLKESK